jgi:hypothetical protein
VELALFHESLTSLCYSVYLSCCMYLCFSRLIKISRSSYSLSILRHHTYRTKCRATSSQQNVKFQPLWRKVCAQLSGTREKFQQCGFLPRPVQGPEVDARQHQRQRQHSTSPTIASTIGEYACAIANNRMQFRRSALGRKL